LAWPLFARFWVGIGLALVFVRRWVYWIGFVLYCLRITAQTIDNRALFRGFEPFKQILAGLVLQAIKTPVIP